MLSHSKVEKVWDEIDQPTHFKRFQYLVELNKKILAHKITLNW